MTIADQIRHDPAAYTRSVALMSRREKASDNSSITFFFADDSSLKFDITYTVARDQADDRPLTALAQDLIDREMQS